MTPFSFHFLAYQAYMNRPLGHVHISVTGAYQDCFLHHTSILLVVGSGHPAALSRKQAASGRCRHRDAYSTDPADLLSLASTSERHHHVILQKLTQLHSPIRHSKRPPSDRNFPA